MFASGREVGNSNFRTREIKKTFENKETSALSKPGSPWFHIFIYSFFFGTNSNCGTHNLSATAIAKNIQAHIRLSMARKHSNAFGYTDTLMPQLTCRSGICVAATWKGSVTPNIKIAGWKPMKGVTIFLRDWTLLQLEKTKVNSETHQDGMKPVHLQTPGGVAETHCIGKFKEPTGVWRNGEAGPGELLIVRPHGRRPKHCKAI